MIPADVHPDREEVIKRKLGGIMDALQAAYELLQAHFLSEDFTPNGEAAELTARVMTDLWLLAQTQMEKK